jgi:hypothetical protein
VTTPAPSGGPSPLRVSGLALIGVAAVAAIIGLVTVATNGSGEGEPAAAPALTLSASATAPAGPAPSADAPQPGSAAPTTDGSVPPFGPTPTAAIAAPPTAQAPGAAPGAAPAPGGNGTGTADGNSGGGGKVGAGGGSEGSVRVPLRVYNNSTISGLAERAAADFRNAGWTVEEVANYPDGIIPTSTVYYRPGTGEQAPAQALGDEFGLRVSPRFEGLQDASGGLIVIVTNDYGR